MLKSAPVVFVIGFVLLAIGLSFRRESVMAKSTSGDLLNDQERTQWKVFTQTKPDYGFRVQYPPDWSVEENGDVYLFIAPHAKSNKDSIAIVIINYKKTPPLPVEHTYTTVRTVTVDAEKILVRKRQPAAATEKYFAERKKGDYTAEFRLFLDGENDAIFDRLLSTFTFTFTQ